jgi:hypothetical protein
MPELRTQSGLLFGGVAGRYPHIRGLSEIPGGEGRAGLACVTADFSPAAPNFRCAWQAGSAQRLRFGASPLACDLLC